MAPRVRIDRMTSNGLFQQALSSNVQRDDRYSLHTITIKDDDPLINLSLVPSAVPEFVGTSSIFATLSAPTNKPVSMLYTVTGSATKGSDYTIAPSSPITIASGE